MRKIDKNVWVVETPFKLFGTDMGNRMTVIRLSNGDLFLHSPIKIDGDVVARVKSLGNVAYLVTPNNFHGLFVDEWRAQFPGAKHFTAKNIEENETDSFSLDSLKKDRVNAEIEIIRIEGSPKVNEYAFIHKESKTLILTDIAFNFGKNVSLWSKVFFKLNGAFNKFGPSRLMKTMIVDQKALESSVEKILAYELTRIIVSHGEILESNARAAMINAFYTGAAPKLRKSFSRISFSRCG